MRQKLWQENDDKRNAQFNLKFLWFQAIATFLQDVTMQKPESPQNKT